MLSGTTAFVTGASQGIGRSIAKKFVEEGANVALGARSDGIYETAEEIDAPEQTLPVETDVTNEESVQCSIHETVAEFGGLDCIVNNAGVAGPTASVEAVAAEDWQHTMSVNAMGPFLVVKHAVEQLRISDAGSVINISSISGKRPLENRTPYACSKMALIGLTRTLAFELGEDGITVNTVCPGATAGPRISDVIEEQARERDISFEQAKRAVFTDDTAMGTLVQAEDTAEMVAFLASDHARHVTAQDINVDAGSVWY